MKTIAKKNRRRWTLVGASQRTPFTHAVNDVEYTLITVKLFSILPLKVDGFRELVKDLAAIFKTVLS